MDAATRALVRAAEAEGTAAAWTAAARALARAGLADEAGRAALHLLALGQDPAPAGVAAPPLEAFAAPRVVGERFALGRASALAWSADGATLYVGAGEVLAAVDPASGAVRRVTTLPGPVRVVGPDLAGARVAVAWSERLGTHEHAVGSVVAVVDVPTGEVVARRPLAREWFEAATLVCPEGHVVFASRQAVRAWRLDDLGAPRAHRAVRGDAVSVGPGGFAAVMRGAQLLLFDPLARSPRARSGPVLAGPDLFGPGTTPRVAGRGAVVWEREPSERGEPASTARARRVAPDGALSAPLRLSYVPRAAAEAASPCGRVLAHLVEPAERARVNRASAVVLVDLATGALRRLDLGGPLPRALAWSPGATTLAVGTDEGTIALISAAPAPATPSPPSLPATAAGWLELVRGDRFWRARVDLDAVEVHYGLRGAAGQRRRTPSPDPVSELARRAKEKAREGYAPA